jgi:hypothetical protein
MKNKYLKTIVTFVLLLVCTFTFSITSEAKTTLKLNNTKKTLIVGKSFTLKATSNVKNKKKIKWSTSNKNIVSISKTKGSSVKIKGKKKGTATITCKIGKKKVSCKVKVKKYYSVKEAMALMDKQMHDEGFTSLIDFNTRTWEDGFWDKAIKSDGTPLYPTLEDALANAPGFGCSWMEVVVYKEDAKIGDAVIQTYKDYNNNLYGIEYEKEEDGLYFFIMYYAGVESEDLVKYLDENYKK